MKIIIEISRKEAMHIRSPHTFYNSCGLSEEILLKIQKQVDKKLAKKIEVENARDALKSGLIILTSDRSIVERTMTILRELKKEIDTLSANITVLDTELKEVII